MWKRSSLSSQSQMNSFDFKKKWKTVTSKTKTQLSKLCRLGFVTLKNSFRKKAKTLTLIWAVGPVGNSFLLLRPFGKTGLISIFTWQTEK